MRDSCLYCGLPARKMRGRISYKRGRKKQYSHRDYDNFTCGTKENYYKSGEYYQSLGCKTIVELKKENERLKADLDEATIF